MDTTNRIIEEARYILQEGSTVREAATHFGVSKSTVHADVTKRLKSINFLMYVEIRKLMDFHFSVRHIRGGEATKQKYSHCK